MARAKPLQVRFDGNQIALIEKLMARLGIETRAGLIKHAIARLAIEENIPVRVRKSAK